MDPHYCLPIYGIRWNNRKMRRLIDMKRGQNAGIALARIKMSFAEVKERISLMDDEIFSTDQLRSLSVRATQYLPSRFLIRIGFNPF